MERQVEEAAWTAAADFLVPGSFVLAAVHIGQVAVFMYTSSKTNGILCSATFYLYMNGKVLHL